MATRSSRFQRLLRIGGYDLARFAGDGVYRCRRLPAERRRLFARFELDGVEPDLALPGMLREDDVADGIRGLGRNGQLHALPLGRGGEQTEGEGVPAGVYHEAAELVRPGGLHGEGECVRHSLAQDVGAVAAERPNGRCDAEAGASGRAVAVGNPEWNAVVIAPQDDPAAGSGFEVGIAGKQIRSCVRKRGRFRCGTGCDEFQKIHLEGERGRIVEGGKLIVPISAGLKVSVGEFRFRLRKAVRGRMILLQRAPSGTGSRVPNRLIPAGVRRGSLSNTAKQFGVPFSRFTQSDSALHEDGMLQSRPANRVPFAFGMVSSMAAFPSAASRVNRIEGAGSPARCQVHQGGSPEEPPCEAESIRLKLSTTLPAASSGRRTAEKSGSVNVFIVEEESCYFASR
ncbi:MAG: hypothetical protein L6W00_26420 [Lentisphaeria bacterium]|nr:MAG: hypothetical protein L6W00_26420 [Lentisphaeria bacterium]